MVNKIGTVYTRGLDKSVQFEIDLFVFNVILTFVGYLMPMPFS